MQSVHIYSKQIEAKVVKHFNVTMSTYFGQVKI